MYTVASRIRLFAAVVASDEMNLENQPKFFRLVADFLKKEPEANFSSGKLEGRENPVPLMMNAQSEKALEGLLSESFRSRMPSGKAGMPYVNFLYILGQALVVAAVKFQLAQTSTKDPESKKKLEDGEKSLYEVWGGDYRNLNPTGLFNKYEGKSTAETTGDLASKLEESAKVVESITGSKP